MNDKNNKKWSKKIKKRKKSAIANELYEGRKKYKLYVTNKKHNNMHEQTQKKRTNINHKNEKKKINVTNIKKNE